MSDIQIFDNPAFGQVRTHEDERGVVTFCAKDVAAALGYRNTNDAVKKHCKTDGVAFRYPIPDALGRMQKARFITEPDLYRLIAHSKLHSAQLFEAWVFG